MKRFATIHTEYDYRMKGRCITLSTLDNTYFIAIEIQFAAEYFHSLAQPKKRNAQPPKTAYK